MRRIIIKLLAACGIMIGAWTCLETCAGELKVGVFTSFGSAGMMQALKAEKIPCAAIEKLEADTLFQYDVIVLGSVKGLPYPGWASAVDLYVRCGGGVLLTHDATGFRGWKESLFPELFKGTSKVRDRVVKVAAKDHPLALSLPETFQHAYVDHIALDARSKGSVILQDGSGKPLVVVGEMGEGRVAGCGMCIGMAEVMGEGQGERAPENGERQFLINAVRWLGERPVTAVAADELRKRRQAIGDEIAVRTAGAVAGAESEVGPATGSFGKDWFADFMYNEQGVVRPPMELLPGRFFLFNGNESASIYGRGGRARSYAEVTAVLKQLKWAGVTDVILLTLGPLRVNYRSQVPGVQLTGGIRDMGDSLELMERACAEVGLGVWCFWHSKLDKKDVTEANKACVIRNAQGEIYAPYIDVASPELRAFGKKIIDELAARYNTHGALKGIFLDELWHAFTYDRMEDNVADITAFCRKQFGEAPPADLPERLAKGNGWYDPEDVWWRRYMLWRDSLIPDFTRAMTEYASAKGLSIISQPAFPLCWETGWWWGVGDTRRLAREGNLTWLYEGRASALFEAYAGDRTIFANHSTTHSGHAAISLIRGNLGSLFTFGRSWYPIAFGVNPRSIEIMEAQARASREWFGALSLSQTAVLSNDRALLYGTKDGEAIFKNEDQTIRNALCARRPAGHILVDDIEFFGRFRTLVAPPRSLLFLREETYAALERFVRAGGQLVVLDGKIGTARPDLTAARDRTEELTGVARLAEQVKSGGKLRWKDAAKAAPEAAFPALQVRRVNVTGKDTAVIAESESGGHPLVTERRLDKGRIVAVHFDVAALVQNPEAALAAADFLAQLADRAQPPTVRAEGNVTIYSALRKNNWLVVTFMGRAAQSDAPAYPARGRLRVDVRTLGLDFKEYKVVSLARNRETQPQGKDYELRGRNTWTAESLSRDGIEIYIPPNSLAGLELPYKTEDDYVNRYIMPDWSKRAGCRQYEHEIIAVAPVGEPSMLGE